MTSRDIELLGLKKCLIRFTSPEGDYEGTVMVACPVAKKMLIFKATFLPKRILMGTLAFKFHEILSYTILSRPDAATLENGDSNRSTYSYAPPRAKDMCLLDDCSELDEAEIDDGVRLEDLYEEEEFQLKIPPQLASRIPIDNVVFDSIDKEFHQAIKHIFQQDCIGVSLEGPRIGRNGILSWFCVSTSSCTFLFDVESLGERAFKEGLKKILENPNIEKVLHDCRRASDCLFHKFNTRLVNVFDTQVADLLVTMQRSKDSKFSKRVSSLDSCLRTYLEIPEEYIHKSKVYRTYEDSVVFSRQRPLQAERRDLILKNVMYLRSLKRELNFALLTPLHRGVEVYLQVLQTATDRELLLETSVPEELPQELVMEGIQIVRFKEFVDVPPVVASGPPYRKLSNPVKDYADLCAKKGIGFQNRSLSNMSDNAKSEEKSNIPTKSKSPSVECNGNNLEKPTSGIDATANKVSTSAKNIKCTIADNDMVQKNSSELEENSDSSGVITDSDKPKNLAEIINYFKNRRNNQRKNNLHLSNFSAEETHKGPSQYFQDSSDSDSEKARSMKFPLPMKSKSRSCIGNNLVGKQTSQDVCTSVEVTTSGKNMKCTIADGMVPKNSSKLEEKSDVVADSDEPKNLAEIINYFKNRRNNQRKNNIHPSNLSAEEHQKSRSQCFQDSSDSDLEPARPRDLSSSDSLDSSDDDPWAALRAEFTTCDYSAEHVKRKIRYFPG